MKGLTTAAALLGIFVVLVLPNRLDWITGKAFRVFPLELVVMGLLLLIPGRPGNAVRILLALLLGLAVILRIADLISHEIFGRRFNLIFDSHLLADAGRLLSAATNTPIAILAGLSVVLLTVLVTWRASLVLGHLQRVLQRAPRRSIATLLILLVSWGMLKTTGGSPRADSFTSQQLILHARDTVNSLHDMRAFAATVGDDPQAGQRADSLFSRLEDKDVFIVFAESYGRALLEQPSFSASITASLSRAERSLEAAGFHIRSAFLTAPVVGGQSWLAHATLLSGAWIDSETRYRSLLVSNRIALNRLFREAGWRSVAALPAISMAWPEGAYYGYDQVYNAGNFGYEGLPFNWVTMPDQYVWSALQAQERDKKDRQPLMAEIALISSHAPWTPIAQLVPWDAVRDGRVFDAQAQAGPTPEQVWSDLQTIRDHYRRSIEYMLQVLVAYLEEYGDENLVLLLLGDHQPAPMVSGDKANRDVPVHLIAKDPAMTKAIDSWHWQPGMLPDRNAPVWRMERLRNRFIAAFSGSPETRK